MLCRGKTKYGRRYTSQPEVIAPELPKPHFHHPPIEHSFQSFISRAAQPIWLQRATTVPFRSSSVCFNPFCHACCLEPIQANPCVHFPLFPLGFTDGAVEVTV